MKTPTTSPNTPTHAVNEQDPAPTESKKPKRTRSRKKLVVAPPAPRATTIGLDVGDKFVHFCEIDCDGAIEEGRLQNSPDKIREFFQRPPRRVVIEMGTHTRWMAEIIDKLGHKVFVVDPRHILLVSRSLYKDDRVDAQTLAMLGFESPNHLKTVSIRPLEHQKVLTLVRMRAAAVAARTAIINSIRGSLKPYGLRVPKQGHLKFIEFVWDLLQDDSQLLTSVSGLLVILKALQVEIAKYDIIAEELLPIVAPDAVHLAEIKGVGALTALYFVAIVGDPKRFSKPRDLGAYLGLCRRRDDSGDYKSEMRITKAGDSYMRALLANCASYIIGPLGPDSDLQRWGRAKVGAGSRAEKRKAKVAVARKLAVLMLTLWRTGRKYEPLYLHAKELKSAA